MEVRIKINTGNIMNLVKDRTAEAFMSIGRTMQEEAKSRSPVQTGRLWASWNYSVEQENYMVTYHLYNTAPYSNIPSYYDRKGKRYSPLRQQNSHLQLFRSIQWVYLSNMTNYVEKYIIKYIQGNQVKYMNPPNLRFDSMTSSVRNRG